MNKIFLCLLIIVAVALGLVQAQDPRFNLTGASSGRSAYNASNPEALVPGSGDPKKLDLTAIKPLPTPADAVAFALADIATLPKSDQPFQRYVWVPDANKDNVAEIKYALNLVSRSTILYNPKTVGGGRLVRVDLRMLAPRSANKDFVEITKIWEKYAFDPYFHIIRSTDEALPTNAKLIKSLDSDPEGSKRFEHDDKTWYISPTGKTFLLQDDEFIPRKLVLAKKDKVAVAGAHVGLDQHVMLQSLAQSNVPVVRGDWWLIKTLTVLDGGLYYEWIGIERDPKDTTSLKAFLKKFGGDEELVEKLRGDQRAAMFKSRVTGRPRMIEAFRGVAVRPDSGTGLISITYDNKEGDVDAVTDPIRNLLEFKAAALEVIVEKQSGMHVFALFNAAGELQDSAPDNVVKDHTIPAPHTARLEPAISCIRCHGPFDGWQPFQNEVKLMLVAGSGGGLNVFDDLSAKKDSRHDTLDRLAGLYSGDLSKAFRRGRDDYSDAVFQSTGGMSVPKAAATMANTFSRYRYNEVDAYTACQELGYDVPRDKAVYYLNIILLPLQKDAIGIAPEDPIIGALKMGISIQRFQWENVYADAALRAILNKRVREKR